MLIIVICISDNIKSCLQFENIAMLTGVDKMWLQAS